MEPLSTGTSFVVSLIFTVLIFSGMQIYKPWFAASHFRTIFGGYLGSMLFILSLTAIGNLKSQIFGKQAAVRLYPEALICLMFAMFASITVHRVCGSTCLLFSIAALYFVHRYSQSTYATNPAPVSVPEKKKRK